VKSRKLLIGILVIALLAVYYLLGTDYLKQQRNNASLASQITVEKDILAQIPPLPDDLETRLNEAQTGLENARNVFPETLNSTRIIDDILRLADDVGVNTIPLVTQPWTTEAVEGVSYSILRLNLTVSGTFEKIADYLNRLETGEMDTLVMEHVTVNSLETPFGGTVTENDVPPTVDAVFEVAVYSQPPVIIEPELDEEGIEE
jgi:hypothetical protein